MTRRILLAALAVLLALAGATHTGTRPAAAATTTTGKP